VVPSAVAVIVGAVVIDEHHLTEVQILVKARAFYAGATPRDRGHSPPE